jgi:hypothetical protein
LIFDVHLAAQSLRPAIHQKKLKAQPKTAAFVDPESRYEPKQSTPSLSSKKQKALVSQSLFIFYLQ